MDCVLALGSIFSNDTFFPLWGFMHFRLICVIWFALRCLLKKYCLNDIIFFR